MTASDLGTPSLSSSTTARMFKIRDANRMVLVVNKAGVTEAEIGEYRDLLQQIIGKDIIIGQYRIRRSFFHSILFCLLEHCSLAMIVLIWTTVLQQCDSSFAVLNTDEPHRFGPVILTYFILLIRGNMYKLYVVLLLRNNCNFLLSLWLLYLILLTSQRGQPLAHC